MSDQPAKISGPIPVLVRLADELRDLRLTIEAMREENAKLRTERDHYEAQFMELRSFLGNASRIWYNMNDDLQAKYKAALGEKLGEEEAH